jgi:hypothetical protein
VKVRVGKIDEQADCTMMRLPFALVAMALLPGMAVADEPASACVNALEQVTTLQALTPVYKPLAVDQWQYIDDVDRPAEIARLQKIIGAYCSAKPQERSSEDSAAQRLHVGRSPECAFERDKLSAMEKPGARAASDSIEGQRKRVAEKCPLVETANVWLLKMVRTPH